jgi:8-oxo-dGTP pyrophosphatase MutT (NUDIX family)
MIIKIYFNNKPLFLTDTITRELEDYLHRYDTIFIDEFNLHTVRTMIYEMQLQEIYAGVFLYNDINKVLNAFKKELKLILAAGGFVHSDEHVLLIFRKGKWDLPKGKADKGEDLETCAIREIIEETGLDHVKSEMPLCITYHTYHEHGAHILKESHWYLMNATKNQVLVPQKEEDIEKCEWVPFNNLSPYLDNTHTSIIDVVKEGINTLHKVKNS